MLRLVYAQYSLELPGFCIIYPQNDLIFTCGTNIDKLNVSQLIPYFSSTIVSSVIQ